MRQSVLFEQKFLAIQTAMFFPFLTLFVSNINEPIFTHGRLQNGNRNSDVTVLSVLKNLNALGGLPYNVGVTLN